MPSLVLRRVSEGEAAEGTKKFMRDVPRVIEAYSAIGSDKHFFTVSVPVCRRCTRKW